MEKSYKIKAKNKKETVYFRDPNPFTNIGQVEYVFLDKTGTLTKKNFSPNMIYFNNKLFFIDMENFLEILKKKEKDSKLNLNQEALNYKSCFTNSERIGKMNEGEENQNFSSEDEINQDNLASTTSTSSNLAIKMKGISKFGKSGESQADPNPKEPYNPLDKVYNEEDFLNLTNNNSIDDNPEAFFESIVLSSNSKVTYIPQKDHYIYDCLNKEGENCLNFANKSDFIYERYDPATDFLNCIFKGKELEAALKKVILLIIL